MGVNGIYGLSGSGLDIESLVKVGMMSRQSEYDKMAQKYTTNEWKKTALLDISNQITTFNLSGLTDYKLSSKMNSKTATSSDETAITATANAASPLMTHKVTVDTLSHNAYLIGYKKTSEIIDSGGDTSKSLLKDLMFKGLSYGSQKVTSAYTTAPTEYADTNNYTFSGGGLLTSTNIHLAGGKINSVTYTGTDQTTTKNIFEINQEKTSTTLLSGQKTSSFELSDLGIKLNVNVTKANENSIAGYTYSFENLSDATINSSYSGTVKFSNGNWVLDFKDQNNPANTLKTTIAKDGSVKVETGSTTLNDTSTSAATITYAGNAQTKTTTTFNDGTVLNTTETRDSTGITDISSATITTKEKGIVGKSADSGTDIGADFTSGKATTVSLNDVAIAFTVSDGEKESDIISYTYREILGIGDGENEIKPLTMNDLASKIKTVANANGVNVKAEYDNLNGRFSLYNPNSDKSSAVIIKPVADGGVNNVSGHNFTDEITKSFFDTWELKSFNGTSLESTEKPYEAWGGNGKIIVDGIEYETEDNKVTVGGVAYTATNKTLDAAGNPTAATVTVGQDVDGIVDRVKSFVESYNKILGSLYDAYNEKPESGYSPLTQSQKDSMKDEQVEKWEEKAKKGLLYHDQTLYRIINQMRNTISTEVEGVNSKYNSAYSIGISTTGIYGQLKLDEEKLKNALAEDSEAAYNVFAKLNTTAESDNRTGVVKENGIAQRLGDVLTSATKTIRSRAGSSADITEDSDLNNLLRELQTKMSNFKKLMSAFEDKLYKKYDAMEVALSKLGSQLNFITGGQ